MNQKKQKIRTWPAQTDGYCFTTYATTLANFKLRQLGFN